MILKTSLPKVILLEPADKNAETHREEVTVPDPVSQDIFKGNDDKVLNERNKSLHNDYIALVNLEPTIAAEDDLLIEMKEWDIAQMPIDIIETLPEINNVSSSAEIGFYKVLIILNYLIFFKLIVSY